MGAIVVLAARRLSRFPSLTNNNNNSNNHSNSTNTLGKLFKLINSTNTTTVSVGIAPKSIVTDIKDIPTLPVPHSPVAEAEVLQKSFITSNPITSDSIPSSNSATKLLPYRLYTPVVVVIPTYICSNILPPL